MKRLVNKLGFLVVLASILLAAPSIGYVSHYQASSSITNGQTSVTDPGSPS